ncbi:MAG: OmpA family protein [Leptonema sp. (in: Bacteria)]|nr:OmpA family protein [Leptonema sp. (in: bacteria)]
MRRIFLLFSKHPIGIDLLIFAFIFTFISNCSWLPKRPFGYSSYSSWLRGCGEDYQPTNETNPTESVKKASDYLEKVYSDVENEYNNRNAIIEKTQQSFRALGFELKKETDNQGNTTLLRATIDGDIAFKTGSADLTAEALEIVDKFGTAMSENPNTVAKIHGHTDSPGSKQGNRNLSLRRASAVRDSLVKRKNIEQKRILEVQGFADDQKLIQTNKSEPRNRRTEILIGYRD